MLRIHDGIERVGVAVDACHRLVDLRCDSRFVAFDFIQQRQRLPRPGDVGGPEDVGEERQPGVGERTGDIVKESSDRRRRNR